jgi:tetratricopeptide (TPR) repeat protein
LYGRYFLNKNPQEAILNKSIEYFEKSLEADPNFTLAYAGMARAYMLLAHYGLFPWMEGRTKARELALEALKIDNTLADAHCILGNLARYDFKWEEAIKEFQVAIDYEPDNPTAHDGYAMILFATGSKEEARKQINKARELDPLSTDILETSALFYINEGRTEEFGGELRKIMEIDSGNNHVYRLYPSYYIMKGDTLNAIRAQRKVCDTDPVYSKYATEMMNIYNKFGYKAALEFLLKVEIENKNPIFIAVLCITLNRKEEALTWLEKAYEEHHSMLYNIYYAWPFSSLRSEPRFQAIIRKMGLSEYINHI